MPSDLLAPEAQTGPEAELLNFLKGKDNPFDLFVAARKPEADFPRFHVPAVHRELFATLNATLERFRLDRLERESDLPRSGVVVVLGLRGMGKTHTVHALQRLHAEEAPRVLVTPAIYEPHRPFIEYLLHQLVRHFQNETDGREPGTLERLADALARQVLIQAFHGMTEIDWLARNVTGRWNFWKLFFGIGARRLAQRKRQLIQELDRRENRTVREVCAQVEQDVDELRRLALEHVERVEPIHTVAGQIRRTLYTRLVQIAFGEPRDAIYEFLLDGFTQVEAKTQPSRETLVDELFQALLELCLLARMPVVFAFDALESLLGDPPEEKLCHPFFKGLADVLDSHRGIPFLLFAESGHWEQARKFMSSYAETRFQQGVIRVPKYGSVSVLRFPPVTAGQLSEIVAARMRPLLVDFHGTEKFDTAPQFPFRPEDLDAIARARENTPPPLRFILQQLRDRYDELVNGVVPPRPPRTGEPSGPRPDGNVMELETRWQQALRTARQKLETGGLAALADEMHAGVLKWFEALIAEGAPGNAARPTAAENKILGGHPTYGQITRFQWTAGEQRQELGLGFLLGVGPGMPRDLETKLKIMAARPAPVETLIILWPKGADLAPPVQDHFPSGTRAVWDQHEKSGTTRKVQLRAVDLEQLAPWLALPNWLKVVRPEVAGAADTVIHHFIAERCAGLLPLVTPRS